MQSEINAYVKNSMFTPNSFDTRINLFSRSMAMLDASVMLDDYERAKHIVDVIKDHMNVETDISDQRVAVQLYRILDFIEVQLYEPNVDKNKLRELIQLLGSL